MPKRSQYPTVRAAVFACFAWLVLFSTSLQGSEALPEYPDPLESSDHRVVAVDVADIYGPLREFLTFESKVSARYTLVILDKAEPTGVTALRAYAMKLHVYWAENIDAENEILIVFMQSTGDLWMVPGQLWTQMGFEGSEISAVIRGSAFPEGVAATEYAKALSDLVLSVDVRLAELKLEKLSEEQIFGSELERAWSRLSRMKGAVARHKADSGVHSLVGLAEDLLDDTEALRTRPAQARRNIRRAQHTMDTAQRYVDDTRRTKTLWDRLLPILAGLLILIGVGLVVWRSRGSESTAKAQAKDRVEDWAERLGRVEIRLLEVQNSHPSVYGTAGLYNRFEGASLEQYTIVGRKSDEVFVCCHVLKSRLEEARAQLKLAGDSADDEHHQKIVSLLEDDILEVGVSSQEKMDYRRLVPDEWGDRRSARAWLEWVETPAYDWLEPLRELDEALRQAPMQLVEAKRSLKRAQSALLGLEHLGIDTTRFAHLFSSITPRLANMEKQIWTDPLGTMQGMESFRVETADLESSATACMDSVRSARTGLTGLREQLERVETLRKDTETSIGEPGFEPEAMLADALDRYAELIDAVVGTNPERTSELAQEIVERSELFHRLVDTALEARGSMEAELERLTAELEDMEGSYPDANARLDELETKNNDVALTVLRGRVEEVENLLGFARQCAAAFDGGQVQGLRSREVLRRFEGALGAARTVFDELEDVNDNFAELRNEALQHLQDVERDIAMVKQMVDRDARFAPADHGEQVKRYASELARLRHELHVDRPDCVGLHRICVQLGRDVRKILDLSVSAQREYQLTGVLQEEVRALADQVSVHVSLAEFEDSPARERYEQGRVLLAQIRADLACQANPDWKQANRILTRAQRLLKDSEFIAHERLNDENVARRAIADVYSLRAELALSRPDVAGSEADDLDMRMSEAQSYLEAGQYGEAIAAVRGIETVLNALADKAATDAQVGTTEMPDAEDVRWEALHLWAQTPRGGDGAFGTTSGASGFTV